MSDTEKPQIDINDAETWDDTSLVKNWNEAFEEYKKYHGLKRRMSEEAQGELDRTHCSEIHSGNSKLENAVEETIGEAQQEAGQDVEQEADDEEQGYEDEDFSMTENPDGAQTPTQKEVSNTNKPPQTARPIAASPEGPTPLAGLDESVKQLVMAWYWAGYYQGLHVGRNEKPN